MTRPLAPLLWFARGVAMNHLESGVTMTEPYVYIKTESSLWTVGFYKPDGEWVP